MLEALAHKKVRLLMERKRNSEFGIKSRPQEDLITSSVFGGAKYLENFERQEAISIILGEKYSSKLEINCNSDLEVALWRRFYGVEGRRFVEPDVVLTCEGRTVLVEVKWHAKLSERQVEQQISAALRGKHDVVAAFILGDAGPDTHFQGIPVFRRTWREVSADLKKVVRLPESPLRRWATTLRDALQNTSMGHTFAGLGASSAEQVDIVDYRFSSRGRSPWFEGAVCDVPKFNFVFQGNVK
ncbi:hypothetical protein [Breoghania sp.]|uniref:hypothetical protein n=1 Tax=Breoghania sp. TaxID=2065378 RepID=UPI002AA6F136|nr:hypothetical protein [Breoghania sp.]